VKKQVKKVVNGVQNYVANTTPKQFLKDTGKTLSKVDTYEDIFGAILTTKGLSTFSKIGTVNEIEAVASGGLMEGTSLLQKFSSGATKLMSSEMLAKYPKSLSYGGLDTFVAPTAEVNDLLSQGISRVEMMTKLGIKDPNFLKGNLIRIDVEASQLEKLGLKATTGAEAGANSAFVPGGETVGGVSEGILTSIPKGATGVTKTVITN
jgi:hypothetical protein